MPRPAKYTSIADALRRQIRAERYPVGSLLPAEEKLAEDFAVHRLTLRRAIDHLASQGTLARQEGRGTLVLAPTANTVRTLAFIGEADGHFHQPLYARLCAEAQDHGLSVTAFNPHGDANASARLPQLLQDVYCAVCTGSAWRRFRDLMAADTRVVRLTDFYGQERTTATETPGYIVSCDTYRAARLAVETLAERGHRRIALLESAWPQATHGGHLTIDRNLPTLLGYRSALHKAGIAREYLWGIAPHPMDTWTDDEHAVLIDYLRVPEARPTAVVCAGDFRASLVLRALHEMGLSCPDELSIIGIGNTPWAMALTPTISSIDLGQERIARLAVLLASEPMPDQPDVVRVAPKLVDRKSVQRIGGT